MRRMLEREGAVGPILEHATHGMSGARMFEQPMAGARPIADPQVGCEMRFAVVKNLSEPGSLTT